MFTFDVRSLTVGTAHRSACCDARGRLQGLIDIIRTEESALVCALEGRTAASFIAHYDRYLLMDDAELTDVSDGRSHVWVEGLLETEELSYPRRRAGRLGTDVLTTDSARYGPFDDAGFECARIAAGDVRWPQDMSEKQLVHELGLRDEVLSFGKGCYLGQETINRLDVRGGVKQRLVGLDFSGPVSPGTPLLREGSEVGVARSTVQHPSLGWIGLAVIRMPSDAQGTTLSAGPATATVVALPREGA